MSERKCERIMRKTMFTYVFVLGRLYSINF